MFKNGTKSVKQAQHFQKITQVTGKRYSESVIDSTLRYERHYFCLIIELNQKEIQRFTVSVTAKTVEADIQQALDHIKSFAGSRI